MKKILSFAGILAAAAMTLVGCAQEIDQPEQNGYAVEFTADLDVTKTVNDGLATKWSEGDKLNVFYAKAGTAEYSSNIKFTLSDAEEGRFTGVLDAPLGAETYDWFAQYPYSSYIKTPANTSTGYTVVGSKASSAQIQTAADSKAHIAGPDYPLFGRALAVPSNEAPSAVMHHGTSLLEVVVKNERAEAISVSSIAFTAPEDIVGTYYIDFTGEELVYTSSGANYVSNTATLSVEPAVEVAAGASSKFYLAVKPFTAPAESSLTLSVNNNAKNTVLAEAKTFEAGVTNTLNYTVSADDEIAEPVEIVATIAEFIAAADNYNIYILTGEITEVANTTYGNFYIKDETGELYIFGLCSPEGETKYWAESGLAVGDIVTVKGGYTLYGTTHEMVNAIYVSHTSPDPWDTAASYVNGAEATDDARMKELRAYADADYLYVRLTATNATPFGANYLDFFFTDGEGTTEVWWGWTNTGTDIYYQEHKCELNEIGELTKMRWYPVEGDRVYIEDYTTTVSDTEVLWDIKFPRSYVDVYKSSTGTVHMSFILWSDWEPYWAIPARWNPMLEVTLP